MAWQGSTTPDQWGKDLEPRLEGMLRHFILLLDRRLVLTTPTDTGRAKSNWIVTEGAPESEESKTYDSQGSPSIQSAEAYVPHLGMPVYISNNVPYIGYLEYGTDKFSAYNMVSRSVPSAQRAIRLAQAEQGAQRV